MSFEQLFNGCSLNVFVPDTSVSFPTPGPADDWLASLTSPQAERTQAFFDERLTVYLTVTVDHPSSLPPTNPPKALLDFFAHTQVSLEATYISPTPSSSSATPTHLSAPPRSTSIQAKSRLSLVHPSIIPPSTPTPIPSTADNDRKYVQAEGTLLVAKIWGQDISEDSQERFVILWSETRNAWIAVYTISLVVSFLRLPISDPLLSLTVSTTLRENAVPMQPNHPFIAYRSSVDAISPDDLLSSTPSSASVHSDGVHDLTGLEEINLLEGLAGDPSLPPLSLPSTRIGNYTRRQIFSLPALDSPRASPTKQPAHPTLRKAFMKTMRTVSGFRVRMRTLFVPYVMMPGDDMGGDGDGQNEGANEPDDALEAGSDEHTVVLSVEIDNTGDAHESSFLVESIDVKIGGEGAVARLIPWGEALFAGDSKCNDVFPLRIGPMEQFNLLYAVSFMQSPADVDAFTVPASAPRGGGELHRAVTITVNGRPYLCASASSPDPTPAFPSRWHCILDLSPRPRSDASWGGHDALPEPPSPFPPSLHAGMSGTPSQPHGHAPPQTPAYPAYPAPTTVPPTPSAHAVSTRGAGGAVDMRRERAPGTPGASIRTHDGVGGVDGTGPAEPIIISIRLLPPHKLLRAYDEFTLDIFVFNRSSWTRRFEVSYPVRHEAEPARVVESSASPRVVKAETGPAILPLSNRVRVGPLLPSTCQSVRMAFVAMRAGVHAVEVVRITDVESGVGMNLREVVDVVVHE